VQSPRDQSRWQESELLPEGPPAGALGCHGAHSGQGCWSSPCSPSSLRYASVRAAPRGSGPGCAAPCPALRAAAPWWGRDEGRPANRRQGAPAGPAPNKGREAATMTEKGSEIGLGVSWEG